MLILRGRVLYTAEKCFSEQLFTTIVKPATIDHWQTISSKWWLPRPWDFLLFCPVSAWGTDSSKALGLRQSYKSKSLLPVASVIQILELVLSATTQLARCNIGLGATWPCPQETPGKHRLLTKVSHAWSQCLASLLNMHYSSQSEELQINV